MKDHERPLNARGRQDAPRVGSFLLRVGWRPDWIASSDAMRTRETCQKMSETMPDVPVTFLGDFYHAGINEVREAVPMFDEQYGSIMILGHNPGWEQVVHWLSGTSVIMKTATVALLQSDRDTWSDTVAMPGRWVLHQCVHPSEMDEHA